METPLTERWQVFTKLLPEVTQSEAPNAELVLNALSDVRVRDGLLKTFASCVPTMRSKIYDNLFSIATDKFGEVVTDWSPDILSTLAGLSLLQELPNEAKMYAEAGKESGSSLCNLVLYAMSRMPELEACKVFAQSISAVTIDDCLDGN